MVNRDKLALDHGRVPDDALLDGFAEGMVSCIQSVGYGVVRWVAQPPLSVPTDGIVMAESVCLMILVILSLDDNSKP